MALADQVHVLCMCAMALEAVLMTVHRSASVTEPTYRFGGDNRTQVIELSPKIRLGTIKVVVNCFLEDA